MSASTQNQAFNAILFLYRDIFQTMLSDIINAVRAKRPARVPVVLSQEEVARVLSVLSGINLIMASLLYGCGLRIMECCRLRVKDIDFDMHQITIFDGKGQKDRVVMLPEKLVQPLLNQLQQIKLIHEKDVANTLVVIPSDTGLLHTCWKTGMTKERFRICSATKD